MSESSQSAFPAGLLERVRHLDSIYKQTVKLLPVNQGSITSGNNFFAISN